ncbi:bola-like protein [Tilletiopsis washingtonensis]|uniref:Bola-like protein n=1 Tax=Tilletiopsis washingtonensis TaxID=58919 RepID=A0A316Z5D8_9BASI|nr:bola-like protein [Tilletiopsis washingtonensis]PWN96997.1 bola-like protein [Tilletiopsis washingtonensis]
MVSQAQLEQAIRAKVEGVTSLVVSDVSGGCGQAYDVIIVSPIFEGLPTLKRHRLVNELLKEQIAELHAFSQKTFTPKQYEAQGSKTAPLAPVTPPVSAGSLSATSPAPRSHHRSTSSVSVPELTLTTDGDTLSGMAAQSAGRPLTPGAQPGGTTSTLQDVGGSPDGRSSHSPSISNLHFNKISSAEFWEHLRAFLEGEFMGPAVDAGSASPNTSGRPRGEAELVRVFEEMLSSQRGFLSASDIARIRDGTGMTGQGGV